MNQEFGLPAGVLNHEFGLRAELVNQSLVSRRAVRGQAEGEGGFASDSVQVRVQESFFNVFFQAVLSVLRA